MDFKDKCKQLAERISALKESIQTEEATKNAFIMPFIQMLGYDVFDPLEVIPEMDCDISKKKGEKIDYAIVKDGEPIILIECKHWKQVLSSASELKYMSQIKNVIKAEFASPSPELVRLFTKRVYDGVVNQRVLDQFTELVKRSLLNHVNDVMSERLNVAIKTTEEPAAVVDAPVQEKAEPEEPSNKIVTTEEELEAFYIVKAILRTIIPADRITHRDAQSYFAIFVDDNNRKPICRLYFNKTANWIGIFDADKNEVKHRFETIDDIYQYQDDLKSAIQKYL